MKQKEVKNLISQNKQVFNLSKSVNITTKKDWGSAAKLKGFAEPSVNAYKEVEAGVKSQVRSSVGSTQATNVEPKTFYTSYTKLSEVKLLTIGLASPLRIRQWAEKTLPNGKIVGEVLNANTLHHKTFKPQKGGLFCERIFGPLKDFECACGKVDKTVKQEYKTNLLSLTIVQLPPKDNCKDTNANFSIENTQKNLQLRKFCPVCDVEYTWSVIRRYQLGYIKLVTPVTHVWYLKGTPSYLSILLDIKKRYLQNITYCSETLTLENSLRGNVGFLLNSPSEIFNLWQNSIKKLSTKKESYEFDSNENNSSQIVSYGAKSNQTSLFSSKVLSKPKTTIFRMNNYAYFFEDLSKNKINPSYPSYKCSWDREAVKAETNLLEFVTSLEFNNGIYLDLIPSIFDNLSTALNSHNGTRMWTAGESSPLGRLPSKAALPLATKRKSRNKVNSKGLKVLDMFTKNYRNELPTSIYIICKAMKNLYKEGLMLAIKKVWKQIYQKSYITALKKIHYLVQHDKNRTILKSVYKQIEFAKTKSLNLNGETHKRDFFTVKNGKIYLTMLKQVISLLKKLYKKQIIDRIKHLQNEKNLSSAQRLIIYNIMNSSYSQSNIITKISESIETYLLNDMLAVSEKKRKNSETIGSNAKFNDHDRLLSIIQISNIFTKALLKPLFYKYLLSLQLSSKVKKEVILFKGFCYKGRGFREADGDADAAALKFKKASILWLLKVIKSATYPVPKQSWGKGYIGFRFPEGDAAANVDNLQIGSFENQLDIKKKSFNLLKLSKSLASKDNDELFKSLSSSLVAPLTPAPRRGEGCWGLGATKRLLTVFGKSAQCAKAGKLSQRPPKSLKIISNIYCLSHRELWDSEKDWQLFMLYNSSNSLTDLPIPAYKYRLFNLFEKTNLNFSSPNVTNRNFEILLYQSSTTNAFFSGPGMVYQLLNELNFNEIKKLDKQNRLILYQLNKYISKIKLFISNTTSNLIGPSKNVSTTYRSNSLDSIQSGNQVDEKNLTIASSAAPHPLKVQPKQNLFKETISYNMNSYFVKNIKATRKLLKDLSKKRDLLIRRTKLIRKLFKKDTDPSSMILTVLPVLPPDLRPIVKMGGQIAASDLNRLYQRVIYRNDRLKKFLKDPATSQSYEMKYAQRLLQEAVDNLIQNGKSGVPPEKDTRGRILKSLSDILKGKQGRFRQYLLGKRVDYSGRSVIVVGPKLKLHECGLPFEMAVELYLPFLLKSILNQNYAKTVIGAKTLIQTNRSLTWELLREILLSSPVLLNRAPTLHRLGIQAFQPKLIEGRAILLHPLVCSAFNADFDGDQMAVHVPITVEARAEAWKLMLARNNILSPATGDPLAIPSQDMVLGCYYLTTYCNKSTIQYQLGSGFYFQNLQDVLSAYYQQKLDVHALVWVKWSGLIENGSDQEEPIELRVSNLGNWQEIYKTSYKSYNSKNQLTTQYMCTTPGRILMNSLIHDIIKN